MTVRRHPVEDALHALLDFSAARLCLRRILRIGHPVPFLTVAMRAGLNSFDASRRPFFDRPAVRGGRGFRAGVSDALVVAAEQADRKSTRLNSSHSQISYAV